MVYRRALPAGLLFSLVCSVLTAADLPRKAPDFTIALTNGQKVSLSSYKGKVVAMCFILTGCPHCQQTIGYLVKDQAEYGPRGFQVLASAINQDAQAALPGFINSFHTTFPVGFSDALMSLEFMQHPPARVPHMPLLAFIDRKGMVRAQHEGEEEAFFGDRQEQNLRAQIEALLDETPAPPKGPARKSAATKKGS